jgi:hypothetical protein
MLSRTQRAHFRLSWAERLKRNGRKASEGQVKITLFGVPDHFADFLGLRATWPVVALALTNGASLLGHLSISERSLMASCESAGFGSSHLLLVFFITRRWVLIA